MGVLDIAPAGVVSGKDVYKVFDYARENKFAIPAFNVTVSTASPKRGLAFDAARRSRAAFRVASLLLGTHAVSAVIFERILISLPDPAFSAVSELANK